MIPVGLVLLIILFALWNGYVINWKQDRYGEQRRWSKLFHGTGWFIRLLLHGFLAYATWDQGWITVSLFQLAFLNFTYTGYDVIINIVRGMALGYIDNKGINGFILRIFGKRTFWIVRIVFFITSITLLLWHLI